MAMNGNGYTNPAVLVETDWAGKHLEDPGIRFVEVDEDTTAYQTDHIPGAVGWNWETQLQDQLRRDVVSKEAFEKLLINSGIDNQTTVVLYGDHNNWFAAYAFWLLKYYGHRDVKLLNGGRAKWIAEGRPTTSEEPEFPEVEYRAHGPDQSLRAFRDDVFEELGHDDFALVDVRSPAEFAGELLAPEGKPQEGSQRGGHIPGAQNIGWSNAVRDDGSFKSADELKEIYERKGVTPDKKVIAYCRIGERSSHTWFVLKNLLGYPNVQNYDGSWTEWGSSIGLPVERD